MLDVTDSALSESRPLDDRAEPSTVPFSKSSSYSLASGSDASALPIASATCAGETDGARDASQGLGSTTALSCSAAEKLSLTPTDDSATDKAEDVLAALA